MGNKYFHKVKMLKITTGDGKVVEVKQEFRQMSKLVDEALLDNAEEEATITEANVNEKLDLDGKCELLMAANQFHIPALFELCCASIAAFFKGKDFEKIKGDFGLQDVTYTPEDEEKLKQEYPWIMEQAEKKIAEIQAEIEKKANQ